MRSLPGKRWAAALLVGLFAALAGPSLTARAAAETDFTQQYSKNMHGGVTRAANSAVTCVDTPGSSISCADARSGGNASNNSYYFTFVDGDGDASTFNSSSADLKLPAGATVDHARLYWGANVKTTKDTPGLPPGNRLPPDESAKNQVKLKAPGGGYQTVTASSVYEMNIGVDPAYQAGADVTSIVKAAGAGTYTVADVQAARGISNLGAFGGWTLVVAYADPASPLRNVTIYDGFRLMERFHEPITIDLAGFTTPTRGAVHAELGAVVYDGDRGGTGDSMSIKTSSGPLTRVSDALHTPGNVFNSTISTLGANDTARDPAYQNTLGYDSNIYDVSSAFRNGDTTLRITLTTSNENYAPGVIFLQIDLDEAKIELKKKATVVGGGYADIGKQIEYSITARNVDLDTAIKVVLKDVIPADTTFVPGSLRIASGANAGAKTDVPGDDQAEFDSASNQTVFRVGTGANATTGGEMASGQTSTVTFRVTVGAGAAGKMVKNTAKVSYASRALPDEEFTDEASIETPVYPYVDVSIAKRGPARVEPGGTAIYTITAKNNGPSTALSATVKDRLAKASAGTLSTSTPGCSIAAGEVECALGDLANGAATTIEVRVKVPAGTRPGTVIKDLAVISTTSLDPIPGNDTDTASTRVKRKPKPTGSK